MGSQQAAVSFLSNLAKAAFGLGTAATVLNTSLFTVDGGERAVIFDRFRGVMDQTVGEGTHFLIPILQRPHIFDIRTKPHTFSSISGTKDLQMVNLTLRVLSRPEVSRLPYIFQTLGLEYDEKVLPSIGNEVLKAVVAQFNADQLLTERPHVSALVRESLITRAKDFNIVLDDVAITHLSYGVEFSRAVEQKQVAQQEAERSKFVVMKADQERRAAVIRAEGESEAAQLISDATAKAGMGLIELRRIEASREIASTLARSPNVAYLPGGEVVVKSVGSDLGKELSVEESDQLFSMVFGNEVSKSVLAQWTNQGIRFSPDPETTIGLVQHEGGPCGVLAALQAFVLKYLLYFPGDRVASPSMGVWTLSKDRHVVSDSFSSVTEEAKTRALVRSMCEILFMCGNNNRAVIASFTNFEDSSTNQKDEAMAGGLPIESASDLQKILRFETFTTQSSALNKLEGTITAFQSRMGALLFLISALLSRGLDSVQADRDDPNLPLVTAPFGHASQEIVNLLLCGEAVPNVFDGRMDLGGGMFLKGISKNVDVGFLTLLESLNFCKVGQNLKCPKWPIWVIGSESHYTVLFALDPSVQEENVLELRESEIRRAFDARDESGGGGFISVEAFHQVVQETNIRLPTEKLNDICATGFIVWSELWQVILELDRNLGGIKDSTGMMGKKVFDIYHFNGIAKSDINGGGQAMAVEGGMVPVQRPRLTKLNVAVPPKWTPEEYMSCALPPSSSEKDSEVNQPKPVQHAPLVDCIRTRWSRAACSWSGDPPSIV